LRNCYLDISFDVGIKSQPASHQLARIPTAST
jgi:hypothetical protein